jgi:hypothetical protein
VNARAAAGAALLALACATPARADSWLPPEPMTVVSAAGNARVTVTPGEPGGYDYFADWGYSHPGEPEPAEHRARHARARVERRVAGGQWRTAWEGPLENNLAPLDVLVADDASRLVTFDNWHLMGQGDEVVVVYDGAGATVAKHALSDLVPANYVRAVRRSQSSTWWRGGDVRILEPEGVIRVPVAVPTRENLSGVPVPPTVPLRLRLADGTPLPRQDPSWQRLGHAADAHVHWLRAEWAATRAHAALPIPLPTTAGCEAWSAFARDVRERLGRLPGVHVYSDAVDDPARPWSERSCDRDAFRMLELYATTKPRSRRVFLVYASPAPAALNGYLAARLAQGTPADFAGLQIWLNGTEADVARVRAAANRVGAMVHRIGDAGFPGVALRGPLPDRYYPDRR